MIERQQKQISSLLDMFEIDFDSVAICGGEILAHEFSLGIYAAPIAFIPVPGSECYERIDVYAGIVGEEEEDVFYIASSMDPFLLAQLDTANMNDEIRGRRTPHRRFTCSVHYQISGATIIDVFNLYSQGDYGTGEAGFAVYEIEKTALWLVDDVVRTPEGLPPARDPADSPGPQTLMLPSDY